MIEAISHRLTDQPQIYQLQHLFDIIMIQGISVLAESTIYELLNIGTERRIDIEGKLLDYYTNHKADDFSLLRKINEMRLMPLFQVARLVVAQRANMG